MSGSAMAGTRVKKRKVIGIGLSPGATDNRVQGGGTKD
jgi:hypothetical protein